ncbi:MAG: hypothetical protein ABJA80_14935 [bacterium]
MMPRPAFLRRIHAVPLGLLVVGLLVAVTALVPLEPLRDAATLGRVAEATLRLPLGYLLLAPVSNVLDTVTLLSVRQHVAFLCTVIVCYAVWWWFVGRVSLAEVTPARRVLREVARLGVGLVLLVGLYVAVAIIPRPMAALETSPDVLVIDFHAHTRFSHDGRPGWTPEDVRAWHRDAGFNAAFITDHRTFEGARDGWANNPTNSGEGTLLLPGIEVVWHGEHVNVLDADRMYQGLFDPLLRDVDDRALTIASALPGAEPVLIETMPGNLSKLVAAKGKGTAGVRAIELVDGAPRGLGQTRRERTRIVHLADSLNLALVAGSDNHGWGHTAAAWTLLFLPEWRAANPDRLVKAVSTVIRNGGRGATRVVERYVADTDTGIALPFTVPIVAWGMLRTLSTDERIVWFVWLIGIYLAWRLVRARRRPDVPVS